ncbi:hypothetical protein BGX27_003367 [Mortierella sp. AM989]|nr:hypothetical protein BGX27_003367 [Mortierella sp. AM989]
MEYDEYDSWGDQDDDGPIFETIEVDKGDEVDEDDQRPIIATRGKLSSSYNNHRQASLPSNSSSNIPRNQEAMELSHDDYYRHASSSSSKNLRGQGAIQNKSTPSRGDYNRQARNQEATWSSSGPSRDDYNRRARNRENTLSNSEPSRDDYNYQARNREDTWSSSGPSRDDYNYQARNREVTLDNPGPSHHDYNREFSSSASPVRNREAMLNGRGPSRDGYSRRFSPFSSSSIPSVPRNQTATLHINTSSPLIIPRSVPDMLSPTRDMVSEYQDITPITQTRQFSRCRTFHGLASLQRRNDRQLGSPYPPPSRSTPPILKRTPSDSDRSMSITRSSSPAGDKAYSEGYSPALHISEYSNLPLGSLPPVDACVDARKHHLAQIPIRVATCRAITLIHRHFFSKATVEETRKDVTSNQLWICRTVVDASRRGYPIHQTSNGCPFKFSIEEVGAGYHE